MPQRSIQNIIKLISSSNLKFDEISVRKNQINIKGLGDYGKLTEILDSKNLSYEEIKIKKDSISIFLDEKVEENTNKSSNDNNSKESKKPNEKKNSKKTSKKLDENKINNSSFFNKNKDENNKGEKKNSNLEDEEIEKFVKYLAWALVIFLIGFSVFNVLIPLYNNFMSDNPDIGSNGFDRSPEFNVSVQTLEELYQVVNDEVNLNEFNDCGDFFGKVSSKIIIHENDGIYHLKDRKIHSDINPYEPFDGVCFEIESGDRCCFHYFNN